MLLLTSPPRSERRPAFTLIELLVVIAIIAILASLIVAAVFAVLIKPPLVQSRADITQMSTSMSNFKKEYKVYPPHYIRLRSFAAEYNPPKDQIDVDSINAIRRIFPNIGNFGNPPATAIAWNGVAPYPPGTYEELGPDQCLVFWLGGIPAAGPTTIGFATNPKDPASPGITDKSFRKGPFYEFRSDRLFPVNPKTNFCSYKDAFGTQPYVFFSSQHRYGAANPLVNGGFFINGSATKIQPFNDGGAKFLNPDTFQIISAGQDMIFGPGGPWSANNTAAYVAPGADDLSNFHSNILGAP